MSKLIKMLTGMAGTLGAYSPGDVLLVSDEVAEAWVGADIAELHEEQPKKVTEFAPDQTPTSNAPPAEVTVPVDNSYDVETGELIGFCSIQPEVEGEEHVFGETLYVFVKTEDGKLFFSKLNKDPLTLEAFTELKSDEQKALLAKLQIKGDDGNEEKRIALYLGYLEANPNSTEE